MVRHSGVGLDYQTRAALDNDLLIREQNYPDLYNVKVISYKDMTKKDSIWRCISKVLLSSVNGMFRLFSHRGHVEVFEGSQELTPLIGELADDQRSERGTEPTPMATPMTMATPTPAAMPTPVLTPPPDCTTIPRAPVGGQEEAELPAASLRQISARHQTRVRIHLLTVLEDFLSLQEQQQQQQDFPPSVTTATPLLLPRTVPLSELSSCQLRWAHLPDRVSGHLGP
ncbi:hypothetical protein AAFF_G00151920 [Aldrovandia affinis]|uniref:Uncharacterized protein n=1 Tax=Aldrovandia affinis TaxID=143900 RepID=A0AAD7W8C0_9TELE|nr:hypothetical protein AAFF_G00151920 [Aldrovandia affinis]